MRRTLEEEKKSSVFSEVKYLCRNAHYRDYTAAQQLLLVHPLPPRSIPVCRDTRVQAVCFPLALCSWINNTRGVFRPRSSSDNSMKLGWLPPLVMDDLNLKMKYVRVFFLSLLGVGVVTGLVFYSMASSSLCSTQILSFSPLAFCKKSESNVNSCNTALNNQAPLNIQDIQEVQSSLNRCHSFE